MIAALYVDPTGPYAGRPGVDAWALPTRDARTYAGPYPVVAHPPCAAWGRYAKPTPESTARGPLRGDDGGCFRAALASVLAFGGVLEHPADSYAWRAFGLATPAPMGWTPDPTRPNVWTCRVEQGHYGHAARKPTWLLYSGRTPPPALVWGPAPDVQRPWSGRRGVLECMSKRQRRLTPEPFAALLVSLARHAGNP